MRYILCALISYIMAAPLTSLISFDLTETAWTNLWTYIWWAGSWMVWGLIALCVMAFAAAQK